MANKFSAPNHSGASQNSRRPNFANGSSNKWTIWLWEYTILNLPPHRATVLTKHLDYIKKIYRMWFDFMNKIKAK
jgi:hypothetical protein